MSSNTLFNLVWIVAPKATGGLLLVLTNIVILQQFQPSDFGYFTLCLTTILLVDALVGSAFDLGVVRLASLQRDRDLAQSLGIEAAAFWLKILLVVCLGIVLLTSSNFLETRVLPTENAQALLWFSYAAIVGTLIFRSCMVNVQVDQRFVIYGALEWMHLLLRYGLAIACVFQGERSIEAVIGGFALGTGVSCLVGLAVIVATHGWCGSFTKAHVKELMSCVKWYLPGNAAGALRDRVDIFMLAAWTDMNIVGHYSAARVATSAVDLISMYLSVILAPRIMPRVEAGNFLSMFKQVQLVLTLATVLLALLTISLTGLVIEAWLPAEYSNTKTVFVILIFGSLSGLLVNPLVVPYLAFIKPSSLMVLNGAVLPFVMLGYTLSIPAFGVVGAAWVTAAGRIFPALLALALAWSWAHNHRRAQ